MKYSKLSPELHKIISEEYLQNNISQKDLGKKYGVSNVQIGNILRKYKIPSITRRGFYNVDLSYFKEVNTPNKAYFLGLFHADGCNSEENGSIRINLQEQDKTILYNLKEDIKFSGPINYIKKGIGRKNQCSLQITSIEISQDLKKLGYPSNKTYKVVFPKYLKSDLIKHFIRGVFDGDGCIHAKKHHIFSIVGTFDTVSGIRDYFLEKLSVDSTINETKSKGIFNLVVNKMIDIFNILNHLYNDCELYLERKYKVFYQKYVVEKSHLYWKILCKDIETGEIKIFNNMQEMKYFFGLKSYGSISYCIKKSKNKIWRRKYYLNLLKNE